jgi:hypothetical protein
MILKVEHLNNSGFSGVSAIFLGQLCMLSFDFSHFGFSVCE